MGSFPATRTAGAQIGHSRAAEQIGASLGDAISAKAVRGIFGLATGLKGELSGNLSARAGNGTADTEKICHEAASALINGNAFIFLTTIPATKLGGLRDGLFKTASLSPLAARGVSAEIEIVLAEAARAFQTRIRIGAIRPTRLGI